MRYNTTAAAGKNTVKYFITPLKLKIDSLCLPSCYQYSTVYICKDFFPCFNTTAI